MERARSCQKPIHPCTRRGHSWIREPAIGSIARTHQKCVFGRAAHATQERRNARRKTNCSFMNIMPEPVGARLSVGARLRRRWPSASKIECEMHYDYSGKLCHRLCELYLYFRTDNKVFAHRVSCLFAIILCASRSNRRSVCTRRAW